MCDLRDVGMPTFDCFSRMHTGVRFLLPSMHGEEEGSARGWTFERRWLASQCANARHGCSAGRIRRSVHDLLQMNTVAGTYVDRHLCRLRAHAQCASRSSMKRTTLEASRTDGAQWESLPRSCFSASSPRMRAHVRQLRDCGRETSSTATLTTARRWPRRSTLTSSTDAIVSGGVAIMQMVSTTPAEASNTM